MSDGKKSSFNTKTCHLLNIKDPSRTAKRLKLKFQRSSSAKIFFPATNSTEEVSISLVDVSETGAGFFTEHMLEKGARLQLIVEDPTYLKVTGVVTWSVPVQSGMLIRKFPYRTGLQFKFAAEDEKGMLLEFLKIVDTDTVDRVKKAPPPPATVISSPAPAVAATLSGSADSAEVNSGSFDDLVNQMMAANSHAPAETPAAAPAAMPEFAPMDAAPAAAPEAPAVATTPTEEDPNKKVA